MLKLPENLLPTPLKIRAGITSGLFITISLVQVDFKTKIQISSAEV